MGDLFLVPALATRDLTSGRRVVADGVDILGAHPFVGVPAFASRTFMQGTCRAEAARNPPLRSGSG